MTDRKPIVKYSSYNNSIVFPTRIGAYIIADFAAALNLWAFKKPGQLLELNFSQVEKCYPNGMLPIIAAVNDLRSRGHSIQIILPKNDKVRKMFRVNNWAFFLDPIFPKSESHHDKHLVTQQFKDYKEVAKLVRDFMDVMLRNVSMPNDLFSALEWSVNEICDNVINHSESAVGGFVQLVYYHDMCQISFTVADAGRGILNSLKEGIPTLRTDSQAIGEAIKAGVTRNKDAGQGNGLAGTLRITTMTGGQIDIISGAARVYLGPKSDRKIDHDKKQYFQGTCVSGQICINKDFSISEALEFNGIKYTPDNIIDQEYEMEDQDCLLINMEHETTGVGTRTAGRQMKTKMLNFIQCRPGYPIFINWNGIPVIASSFADEFMGKLFLEIGPLNFSRVIKNKNMEPLVQQLLDKAILQRLNQEKAG